MPEFPLQRLAKLGELLVEWMQLSAPDATIDEIEGAIIAVLSEDIAPRPPLRLIDGGSDG